MKLKQIGEPVVLTAAGAGVIIYSCTTLYDPREGWATSAGLLPLLMGCLLVLFGIIMFSQVFRSIKAEQKEAVAENAEAAAPEKSNWIGVLLVAGVTALFVLGVELVGFLISGAIYAFALMLIFKDRGWGWMVGVAVGSAALLFYSFTTLLHVLLP